MKILGIGNAIVDVLCKVNDEFLEKNSLTKSTMKLVDETEFKNLLSLVKIEETISGGSIANSIVGLSQLGDNVGFIGKISDDHLGKKYEEGLIKENVKQTEKDLKKLFPIKFWNKLHLQIIYYGREYCKARECYGISCKICKTCYPNRRKPLITKKA